MFRCLLFILAIAIPTRADARRETVALQPYKVTSLKNIPEPSDIAYEAISNHLLIVSDNGILFECDSTGTVIRKAKQRGMDFEGVCLHDSLIYVSDESARFVYIYKQTDLSFVQRFKVNWGGAINKAFESITYNSIRHCFLMVAEQPATFVAYDSVFNIISRERFRDGSTISSATFYKDELYLLSGTDHKIFVTDPVTYRVKRTYSINVNKPEGISFTSNGVMLIVSDQSGELFFYNTP